jgi:hypothetical protein
MSGDSSTSRYWSERHHRGPKSVSLDLEQLKRLVVNVLDDLWGRGFFQEALGYECVDAGTVPGTTGRDPSAWFLRTLHRDNIWPYELYLSSWDEDTLLDVIEVFHDLCSEGVKGRLHSFLDCGMHYETFDRDRGRLEYRHLMNPVLSRYERPLELGADGRLVEATPDEFRPLLVAELPDVPDRSLVEQRLNDAVVLFRSRSSSQADRRRAVRDLADALEPLRATIKAEALSKDESELFRLANGFAIRHNNREQLGLYDDEIWLRWAFYVYLATIHATLRLQARQARAAA